MFEPERLTVPTCIGCGAMSRFGTCESGCSEQRLDLVRGATYDALAALEHAACARVDILLAVIAELIDIQPRRGEWELAYRAMRARARDALRSAGSAGGHEVDVQGPAETATAWWCARCGSVDAPQPCLGICVWRPIDWVSCATYERADARLLTLLDRERRLRGLVSRLAWVTPRRGEWERSWRALRGEATSACRGR